MRILVDAGGRSIVRRLACVARRPDPQRLVICGVNGIGKSTLLNLLLQLTLQSELQYNKQFGCHEDLAGAVFDQLHRSGRLGQAQLPPSSAGAASGEGAGAGVGAGAGASARRGTQRRQQGAVAVAEDAASTAAERSAFVEEVLEGRHPSVTLFRDPKEKQKEQWEAATAVGQRQAETRSLEDLQRYRNISTLRPFVLPVGREDNSTTGPSISIKRAKQWALAVSFKTVAELRQEIDNTAWDDEESLTYERSKKMLLKLTRRKEECGPAAVDVRKEASDTDPTSDEDEDSSSGEEGRSARRWREREEARRRRRAEKNFRAPARDETLEFCDAVTNKSGRVEVYVGMGEEQLADRLFIRHTLERFLAKTDTEKGDGLQFAVNDISLFAPVELLEQRVEWRDIAGSGDLDPVRPCVGLSVLVPVSCRSVASQRAGRARAPHAATTRPLSDPDDPPACQRAFSRALAGQSN